MSDRPIESSLHASPPTGANWPKMWGFETPTKRRILLVDDDADMLALLRIWLTQTGFEVSVARNGVEALSHVKHEPPDLIVTDHAMPRVTGLQLCEQLRAQANTRHIPIIMHSAHPLEPADGLYDRAILKPVSLTQISDEIVSLLSTSC